MPTYEYVCAKCGHQFEKREPISAEPLEICPPDLCAQKKWGKGRVKRAISGGAGLLFKGSGFYITDYRSDNYKAAAKKDAPAPAAGDGKPGGGDKAASAKPKAESSPKPAAAKT